MYSCQNKIWKHRQWSHHASHVSIFYSGTSTIWKESSLQHCFHSVSSDALVIAGARVWKASSIPAFMTVRSPKDERKERTDNIDFSLFCLTQSWLRGHTLCRFLLQNETQKRMWQIPTNLFSVFPKVLTLLTYRTFVNPGSFRMLHSANRKGVLIGRVRVYATEPCNRSSLWKEQRKHQKRKIRSSRKMHFRAIHHNHIAIDITRRMGIAIMLARQWESRRERKKCNTHTKSLSSGSFTTCCSLQPAWLFLRSLTKIDHKLKANRLTCCCRSSRRLHCWESTERVTVGTFSVAAELRSSQRPRN